MVLLTELDPRYDVFLSFRGVDTRKRFTGHLYKALVAANYNTFLDDEEIETGEPLKRELESAIKSSRASIIVISKNYASSTWCLDELVLILDQQKSFNQIVIPIFYDVEPTDVRKQQKTFGEAMEKHKQRMEDAEWDQKMELWKTALTQVAGLKGYDANDRMETELIEEIVKDIYSRLGAPLAHTTLPQLIGMKDHIEHITSWLKDGSLHTSDILTILGMGGIGKTSLARHIYELHRHEYRGSFVGDISRRCAAGNYHGLLDVQKQLFDDISKTSSVQVHDVFGYTSKIENALALEKVLLVLDDVDSLEQLDALLGNKGLHCGSKIIITTKDASLMERCALFKTKVKPKHTECPLKGLSMDASLELLCLHAFMCKYPTKGYEEVSKTLSRYCEGHPLALETLGKYLHNRDVGEWEDSIDLLKKESYSRIKNVLMMSFDSLPFENDKELFKHIACFFVGVDVDLTKTILNACHINTRSGIKNLISRCLLSIGRDNKIMMHSLIEDMGRDLVRQESPKMPWKRSRLWCNEESLKVLKRNKAKGNLLGLALDTRMLDKTKLRGLVGLKTESFSQMDNLMLLKLNYVQLNGCFGNFPEELRWLCMHGSPLKSIHLDLPMENLVALDMSYSNIVSFYMSYSNRESPTESQKGLLGSSSKKMKKTPLLGSLKILNLSFCEGLHSLGGFSELPALERLIVRNCIRLRNVCESVGQCVELFHIDMSYCYELQKLPLSMGKLKKVKTLFLDGCNFSESQIKVVPSGLKFFGISLPSSLRMLSLVNMNLCNESFPAELRCLSMLEELYLGKNPIVSMPSCVSTLPRLQKLNVDYCEMVTTIEHPPRTLGELSMFSSYGRSSFSKSERDYKTSLRKIRFDPEMSPLKLFGVRGQLSNSPFEFEGMLKIQGMAVVEEKVLHSLGWTDLEFIKDKHLRTHIIGRKAVVPPTQMYYEFGIFSTLYEAKEMPNWISVRSKGTSISCTIPSSSNNLIGLNFCYVQTTSDTKASYNTIHLPLIKINNTTKNQTWIYKHYIDTVSLEGTSGLFLSHWMFGPSEVEGDDCITITVGPQDTRECGIGFVHDDGSMQEEDVLYYYKSWNHIIGGDLSPFQLTTGEYFLHNMQFMRTVGKIYEPYKPFIEYRATFKEKEMRFKAFSQKKSGQRR